MLGSNFTSAFCFLELQNIPMKTRWPLVTSPLFSDQLCSEDQWRNNLTSLKNYYLIFFFLTKWFNGLLLLLVLWVQTNHLSTNWISMHLLWKTQTLQTDFFALIFMQEILCKMKKQRKVLKGCCWWIMQSVNEQLIKHNFEKVYHTQLIEQRLYRKLLGRCVIFPFI